MKCSKCKKDLAEYTYIPERWRDLNLAGKTCVILIAIIFIAFYSWVFVGMPID